MPLRVKGTVISKPLADESWRVMVAVPWFSALDWLVEVRATVGGLSLSFMVRTVLEIIPRVAPVALVKVRFTVSFSSSMVSEMIGTVKVLLANTPSAQFKVLELEV